jgi:dCTP deaminase
MSEATLFPGLERATGVLPAQALRAAIASREIAPVSADAPILPDQVQPASLDLRLGATAYRVAASFLPGGRATVEEKLSELALYEIDLERAAVLERGCIYIVRLEERLRLKWRTSAHANPKSSTGRLDIFARVIADRGVRFDRIEEQYEGPLFVELAPRTFSIRVRRGSRLVQLRLRRGSPPASGAFHRRLQEEREVIGGGEPMAASEPGLPFTVDVNGAGPGSVIGYKARRVAGLVDIDRIGAHDPREFWEPVLARDGRGIVLAPEDFHILASRETVAVPPDCAAEMRAYDPLIGEFRVHYAGFFDPGFGWAAAGGAGTRAVLEVRSHEVPFLLEHGQTVGRLVYEPLAEVPDTLYGQHTGSYQRQGLALAKQFMPWA